MLTVQDLIDAVISRIDQNNRESVTVAKDILPAINRGWREATDVLARRNEEFLLTSVIIPSTDMQMDANGDYFLITPDDCYQQRVLGIDVKNNAFNDWFKMELLNAQEAYNREDSALRLLKPNITNSAYYQLGRKLMLLPSGTISSSQAFRMRYLRRPLPLVVPQGMITSIDVAEGILIVDAIGDDLTETINNVGNFINIIDSATGEIRSSHQILDTEGGVRLRIRSTPTRTTHSGQTITGVLPATIELDDYVCVSSGTCVPFIEEPATTLAIEYAVAEMDKKLGEPDQGQAAAQIKKCTESCEDLNHNRPIRKRRNLSAPWTKGPSSRRF